MDRVLPNQASTTSHKPSKPCRVPSVDDARKMLLESGKGLKDYFSKRVEFLPTGCSVLNLPICGKIKGGGIPRARVVNIVGDGSSGKTLVALEILAKQFYSLPYTKSALFPGKRRLIMLYYNKEGVMDFKVEKMYGQKFYDAIIWVPVKSVEQFGADLFTRIGSLGKGDTVVAVVDSWDSLDSDADAAKFDKEIEKIVSGKTSKKSSDAAEEKSKGSYELGKQAYASKRFFKKICNDIHQAGADFTLIIISQVRKKIGITFGETQYRAGGDALNFYTHLVLWIAQTEKLSMTRLGCAKVYGTRVRAKVKRSKVWKPYREIDFKILFDYGIDDVGSTFDFVFGPRVENVTWLGEKYPRESAISLFRNDKEQYELLLDEAQILWDKSEDAVMKAVLPPTSKYGK